MIFLRYIVLLWTVLASVGASAQLSATARGMAKMGLQNIADVDPSIAIDLKYTRADNFVGVVLYTDLREAYLHPDAMACLVKAQRLLRKEHPGYSLIVYDAARPMSVQQQMWNVVKGTKRQRYVSNPARGGGMHNYGMAVDITLCNLLPGLSYLFTEGVHLAL